MYLLCIPHVGNVFEWADTRLHLYMYVLSAHPLVSRARRLKYVWSRLRLPRRRNVGDTNQIAERSIITKLLRISHMTVCPLQARWLCYREKSVSESCELARLRPNKERVISFEINDNFCRWCLKCTRQLEQNRKHMLCRLTVKLPTFLRLYRWLTKQAHLYRLSISWL